MGYSGVYQILCEEGHDFNCDCFSEPVFESWKCPYCNKKMKWWNLTNDTNGCYDVEEYITKKQEKILIKNNIDYIEDSTPKKFWTIWVEDDEYCYGSDKEGNKIKLFKAKRIDGYIELEIDKSLTTCTCKDCGNEHILTYPTYKIPKKGGHLVE